MASTIRVDVIGDASSLHKAFGQASSSASSFGSSMAKVGKIAALGLAVGVGVAAVATVKFVKAALEAEKAQTMLDAAFKHANTSAKDRAAAMKAVNDISVKSGLDDEALTATLSKLTQVTGDAGKATTGMGLAADIARGRGIELEAATGIVTKAMLGNVGALKRIGIEIPKVTAAQDALKESHGKATEEQKKAAKAADDLATRQGALAALQKKFGGDAEAYGKTASGAMDRFKVAIENVEEGLGSALLPALAKVAGGVADFLDKFNNASGASEKFRVVIDEVKSVAGQAWTALQQAFNAINWGQIWDSVKTKLSAVDWNAVARTVGDKLVQALNTLDDAIARVDWNQVGAAIGTGIKKGAAALGSLDWGALIVGYMKLQASILKAIGSALVGIGSSLLSGLVSLLGKAASGAVGAAEKVGANLMKGILGGLQAGFGAVLGFLSGLPARMVGVFASVYGNGLDIGKRLMRGMADGISGAIGWVLAQAGGVVRAAKDKLMFWESPPEAYGEKVSARLMQGLVSGMSKGVPGAIAAAGTVVNSIIREMNKLNAEINRIAEQRAAQDRANAVASATAAVAAAIKEGTGVAEARLALRRAEEDVDLAASAKRVTAMEAHLEKLRSKIEAAKAKFAAAWGKIADAAMDAFDKSRSKMLTKSEQQLADIEKFEADKSRAEALAQAQRNLADATTDEERTAAQEEVRRALLAITVAGLTEQARVEREQQDKIDGIQRTAFEKALAKLGTHFENVKHTNKQKNAEILALYEKFGVDYETAGANMGAAVVRGLASKLAEANKLKADLASLNPSGAPVLLAPTQGVGLEDVVILPPPSYVPPLSVPPNVPAPPPAPTAPAAPNYTGIGQPVLGSNPHMFAAGGIVRRATLGMVGESGPEAVIPLSRLRNVMGGGGGGDGIHVHVNAGSIVTERGLEDLIRQAVKKAARRNGGNMWDGLQTS